MHSHIASPWEVLHGECILGCYGDVQRNWLQDYAFGGHCDLADWNAGTQSEGGVVLSCIAIQEKRNICQEFPVVT